MLRVLHVGYGALGRRVVGDLERRTDAEVVAVVDPAPAEADRPIAPDLSAIEHWDRIDCAVVTTRSHLADCAQTFRDLLERGMAVVSTCEELAFPWLRSPKLAGELDALCRRRGARLLGTGINPGFLMDAFPALAASVCREVRAVRVERIQDAAPRRAQFREKIGAGLSLDEFRARVKSGSFGHVGLGESLHLLAHCLGMPLERWTETIEPVESDDGRAAGVRQVARGFSGGRAAVELLFHAAVGAADPHDRVILDGDPPVDLVWKGGVPGDVATSAVVISSIPRLLAASPGLHTMATVPLARPYQRQPTSNDSDER